MANSCLLIIVKEHAKSKKIAISKELQTQIRRDRALELQSKALPKWRLQPESIMRVQIIINSKEIS